MEGIFICSINPERGILLVPPRHKVTKVNNNSSHSCLGALVANTEIIYLQH